MHVKFYTIFGRYDDYESSLKEFVSALRGELAARGKGSDRVSLTLIKVKPEVLDEVLRCLKSSDASVPEHIKYLVTVLRGDNIRELPAIMVNNKKVCEGELVSLDELKRIMVSELSKEVGIDLSHLLGAGKEAKEVRPEEKIGLSFKLVLGKPSTCRECIYYGPNSKYCFLVGMIVEDPEKPKCR